MIKLIKKLYKRFTKVSMGALSLAAILGLLATSSPAFAAVSVVYDAVPSPLPPNVASLGFQATQTSEFGDYVHLAGTDRNLTTVTVTMSDWALFSDYSTDTRYLGNSSNWTHPITLNVYNVVPGSPNTVGSLIGTVTQTITIPWRPVADPTCSTATAWRSPSDSLCYNGLAFNATFDLSSLNVTLPNDVIVSVAYNTQTYGTTPMVLAGPYNSLNVGVPTGQTASVGTDDSADKVFWNSATGTAGVFREDTGWTPNGTVNIQINASAPLVGPATSVDQCKKNGWQTFNNPTFKNQGACVSYVQANEKAGKK